MAWKDQRANGLIYFFNPIIPIQAALYLNSNIYNDRSQAKVEVILHIQGISDRILEKGMDAGIMNRSEDILNSSAKDVILISELHIPGSMDLICLKKRDIPMKTLIAPTLVPSSGSINHAFEAGSREDHCFCNDHVEGYYCTVETEGKLIPPVPPAIKISEPAQQARRGLEPGLAGMDETQNAHQIFINFAKHILLVWNMISLNCAGTFFRGYTKQTAGIHLSKLSLLILDTCINSPMLPEDFPFSKDFSSSLWTVTQQSLCNQSFPWLCEPTLGYFGLDRAIGIGRSFCLVPEIPLILEVLHILLDFSSACGNSVQLRVETGGASEGLEGQGSCQGCRGDRGGSRRRRLGGNTHNFHPSRSSFCRRVFLPKLQLRSYQVHGRNTSPYCGKNKEIFLEETSKPPVDTLSEEETGILEHNQPLEETYHIHALPPSSSNPPILIPKATQAALHLGALQHLTILATHHPQTRRRGIDQRSVYRHSEHQRKGRGKSISLVMEESNDSMENPQQGQGRNNAMKCGWLRKQGGFVKTWHTRWFVLKGDQLYYFKDEDETKPLGTY
ncbi:hypothetical protein E2I00_012860 [Balaenoptera physalus]|uniref:PH domain-containing protein n=1 Tax=Balaenoptera physalus TaxID=9770 RepID=A0A6A1QCH1_BALPH|nr:hypothetical protein E2I00_012860 [Balaenoptera physalus]